MVTVPIPETDAAAREILERFEEGARRIRGGLQVSDSVAQHALEDETSLSQEQRPGQEDEDLQSFVNWKFLLRWLTPCLSPRYVTELTYIHAKLMIVDDRRVIVCDTENNFSSNA